MKFIKKSWKFILFTLIVVALGVYVCFFAITKVRNYEIYGKPTVETKIYTVWHIETFEGGGKSRILYLKDIAKGIEKNNAGVLFNIRQIAPEKLENELNYTTPDIVSFGFGLGKIVLPYLIEQENSYSVRDELFNSGCFSGKLYAIPYIVSGYAQCSHSEDNSDVIYGLNNYVSPQNVNSAKSFASQYEAYKKFANDKKVNLIGTARDIFRVNNLNNIGRANATITPIEGYTDLIQYVGATKTDDIIKLFISNLLRGENQAKLVDYSLFSSLHTKLYTKDIYNDMENAIFNSSIPNVFD